jgi:hypothetical protein
MANSIRTGTWCFLAALVWLTATLRAEPAYRVGTAKVDITPDYPIRLNGFGFRRAESEGVTQPIWAKALAVSCDDHPPVVLLAIDSLGVRMSMVDEVAAQLQKRFGIPRENVALTYSHSHTTPKVNGASDNIFSEPIPDGHQEHIDRYTKELSQRLEQAAAQAIENRVPATLQWNAGKYDLSKNRRTPGGPVDHDLPMLVARGQDGKPLAIYVSYACHCVTLSNNKISGDWAGFAQAEIEQRNPGCIAMISTGAGSDSNPVSGVVGDKVDVAAAQGTALAEVVTRMLGGEQKPLSGNITAQLRSIPLPLNDLPTQEQWTALAAKGGPDGYNATTQLARLDRGESLATSVNYPIQSFAFGKQLVIVFLAGEVCVDYSLRLKQELGADRLWVNAYSNDFCCYIPSERLVREGGYGGGAEIPYFAMPATLKAGLEQTIVDEVKRQAGPAIGR